VAAATSTLTVLEVSNALRKYGLSNQVQDVVNAVYSLGLTMHEMLNVDVRLAADIFHETKISPYDCAHAAIMKRVGIQTIISTDTRDFQKIPGVRLIDPTKYK